MRLKTYVRIIQISSIILTVILIIANPSEWYVAPFAGLLGGFVFATFVNAIAEIRRRKQKGIDIFATLETNPQKVKNHMLFIMQYRHTDGIVGALKEFNEIFRNYPQWKLSKWVVFRAWYKAQIDHMVEHPDIYHMTMKDDGSPYSKEKDPLYDADAPDWEQFDRPHHYYDDADSYDTGRKSGWSKETGDNALDIDI